MNLAKNHSRQLFSLHGLSLETTPNIATFTIFRTPYDDTWPPNSNDVSLLIRESGQTLSPIEDLETFSVSAEEIERHKRGAVIVALELCRIAYAPRCLEGTGYAQYLQLAVTGQLSQGFLDRCSVVASKIVAFCNALAKHPDWATALPKLPDKETRLFQTILFCWPENFTARPETVALDALQWGGQMSRRTARRRLLRLRNKLAAKKKPT